MKGVLGKYRFDVVEVAFHDALRGAGIDPAPHETVVRDAVYELLVLAPGRPALQPTKRERNPGARAFEMSGDEIPYKEIGHPPTAIRTVIESIEVGAPSADDVDKFAQVGDKICKQLDELGEFLIDRVDVAQIQILIANAVDVLQQKKRGRGNPMNLRANHAALIILETIEVIGAGEAVSAEPLARKIFDHLCIEGNVEAAIRAAKRKR
jgi:hypothetical protein